MKRNALTSTASYREIGRPNLVLEAVERCREAAAAMREHAPGEGVDGHDGRAAEEAAELEHVAHAVTDGGNETDGGGLRVDHADGHLVGDDARDCLHGGVSRDGDHVEADRADRGHGFELLDGERAVHGGADHAGVLRDGDERAREAAHRRARHDAALLDAVVEKGERAGGAGAAALSHADDL